MVKYGIVGAGYFGADLARSMNKRVCQEFCVNSKAEFECVY